MASLIWPFHESAAITGADVIATAAASAATIFRMHASSKKADFADASLPRMGLSQARKSSAEHKKRGRERVPSPEYRRPKRGGYFSAPPDAFSNAFRFWRSSMSLARIVGSTCVVEPVVPTAPAVGAAPAPAVVPACDPAGDEPL